MSFKRQLYAHAQGLLPPTVASYSSPMGFLPAGQERKPPPPAPTFSDNVAINLCLDLLLQDPRPLLAAAAVDVAEDPSARDVWQRLAQCYHEVRVLFGQDVQSLRIAADGRVLVREGFLGPRGPQPLSQRRRRHFGFSWGDPR